MSKRVVVVLALVCWFSIVARVSSDGAGVPVAAGAPVAGAIPVLAGAGAGEVVVTGGAGFLGRHLVHLLCSGGWRVTIVDDLSAPHSLSPQLWPSHLQCREAREGQEGGGGGTVRFLQQDCREFFASSESYRHWAAIVHLATRPVSEVDSSDTVGEDASSVLARSLQVTGMRDTP
jgi:hypothetical protein